jgi:O-methyltransferase
MDGRDAIQYVLRNNIEGAVCECGVDAGYFESVWIDELQRQGKTRDIYLYDTFTGLTAPGDYDYTCDGAKLFKMDKDQVHKYWSDRIVNENVNSWCYTPLEKVQRTLFSTGYPQSKLHFIVGDVMETLRDESNIPDQIAILRLDTDWYESSKFELERMYDKVVTGGIIIFDDYYHWDGQRRATDEFFSTIKMEYKFMDIGNYKTSAIFKK